MSKTLCATILGLAAAAALAGPAAAQSACPAGFRFQAPASCIQTRTPGCPRDYQLNANKTLCVNTAGRRPPTHVPSCPAGATLQPNLGCTIARAASCPAGKQIGRNGACVTGVVR
ncbi:MAG: hypothetical protein JNM29_19270 [Candidatus Odyssella sp.]|nr:hypothetical protein [Candidatus Odyssella sp.]